MIAFRLESPPARAAPRDSFPPAHPDIPGRTRG
jgi:hypothetical protein